MKLELKNIWLQNDFSLLFSLYKIISPNEINSSLVVLNNWHPPSFSFIISNFVAFGSLSLELEMGLPLISAAIFAATGAAEVFYYNFIVFLL